MRNADKEITLFNYFNDPVTGYDNCKRTHFKGASVFAQTQVNVDKDGLASADLYTIRIPEEAAEADYLRPGEFNQLEDKGNAFTLAKGDKVVLGHADDDNPRPGDLEKKYGNEFVVTVTGVTDNRGKREPHWKVICK